LEVWRNKWKNQECKGYNIVALGGGTGLSTLLRGLKEYTPNITAVVTVADDGGSSGMIRKDMGILPPGDIRNCILALADVEPAMEQLFQYRFKEGTLKGQNLGNLLIAAMTDIANGFELAVEQISNVLALTGKVYPVSLDDLRLGARLKDETIIYGESKIPEEQIKRNSPIEEVFLIPKECKANPKVINAIEAADAIVLGPGSLYTSLIPNLLVEGISESIQNSHGIKIYVSNIMTQPGETTGYSVSDHIKAIYKHAGSEIIDYVIVNNKKPPQEIAKRYSEENAYPVLYDSKDIEQMGIKMVEVNVADFSNGLIRHNSKMLAQAIMNLVV
jgi:uncharacterized cofD-like protein